MADDTQAVFRYSAFISYPSGLKRIAARLRRDLYAIAKRHPDGSELNIFLDTAALRPGRLDERIFTEVRRSRYLIVLCGPGTATSDWVRDEIKHWLATVGSSERLVMVRSDHSIDLGWDTNHQRFHKPDDVPEPLRHLFDAEQKWIDYSGRAVFRQTDGLTGMCAELMAAEAKDFLQEETAFQRRRTRIVTAVAAVTALLLVVAIISGIAAVRNAQEAEDNASQAFAQADAAEALLAAANSPTLAIERALRATSRSDSPTVRSAMLAVSQATRRLKRAFVFPEEETGHPVAGAGFSTDGAKLLAWGDGSAPGTSDVRVWDVATGVVEASVTAPAAGLRDVTRVDDRRLAACGAAGPIVIDIVDRRATRLDDGWTDGPGRNCEVHEYADGVVVLGADAAGGGSALSLDRGGAITRIEGVDTVAAHPSARSALAAGPEGVVLVTAGRQVEVSTAPASATFADSHGTFLVTTGPQAWGFITQDSGSPTMRTAMVPETAVDVAPLLDLGRITGELAWITGDGTLGWTRDDRRTQLKDSQGAPVLNPYATALEPLGSQDFVAVYRNTAAVVRPPTGDAPSDAPPDTPRPTTDWTQALVDIRIGVPKYSADNPVVARCADSTAVLLATDAPEGGSVLVDGGGAKRRLTSRGDFTAACDAVDAGTSLSVVPQLGGTEPVELRSTLVADSVEVSPVGDQVAVVKSGFPIEVLSTLPTADLPRPWDATMGRDGAMVAFGERELFTDLGKGRLVITDGSGVVERVPVPEFASIAAARPDGTGAAVIESGTKQVTLVDGPHTVPADAACTPGTTTYLPGLDFQRSVTAAEAQIPAVRSDSSVVDCRDGRTVPFDPATEILAYDVGTATGRIVARTAGRLTVTTWSRGNPSSLRTLDGPPLPPGGGTTSFDPTAQLALTNSVGGRRLTLYRRAGDAWTTTLGLATGLPQVVAAQVVDAGTLVIAVSAKGGFELFDVATGRLVASDPGLATTSGDDDVSSISTRRVGDDLFVALQTNASTSAATIRIPVGITALKHQLCALYAAPECT